MSVEHKQEPMEQVNEIAGHDMFTVSTMEELYSVLSLLYLKQNGSLPKLHPEKPKPAKKKTAHRQWKQKSDA